jgi:malonyl CoA-acyl carrier protein transacylase
MISGQKYIKSELKTIVDEQMPINEEITYFPTWFNTVQKQTGMFVEEKKKFVRSTVEDIVISGVSGRFPVVEEMLKEKCWSPKQTVEKRMVEELMYGMESEIETIEPTIKSLVEVTYECIVDAGMSPVELKGLRTGVFVGMNKWETIEEQTVYPSWMSTGKPMLAERLGHFFKLTGPKVTIENELSTSLVVLDKAIQAIKLGLCEVAIVAGVKVGETVGVVLLQKKTTMPRKFYAKVLHSKMIEESLPTINYEYPTINNQIQTRILKEIYAENGIEVPFLEETFPVTPIVKRNVPSFVGINKRIGEETGLFALVKMLLSIKRGIIPSNLKYQEPIEVFGEKLVNKNTKFFGGLMVLNSMLNLKSGRFLNTHILLQPNTDIIMSQCNAESFWNREDLIELSRQPRLFQFSARTKQELEEVLEHMNRKPTDLAMHFLLHPETFNTPITHPYRGFTVLNSEEPIIKKIVQLEQEKKRPIWFILSGLNGGVRGEWKKMAQELMKVDIFRQSIIKSTECLKPYGINLVELIYGQYPLNTCTTLVSITAVQVALIDCLKVAGIKYDGLIGHVLGELLCAYVEQALTLEETILTAYHFGKLMHETKFPLYTMAIVKGLTWEELKRKCPIGIVPVVYNGVENVIISGPKYEVIKFVEELKYNGIYAKEMNEDETTFSHLPFHTELMQTVAKKLKYILEKEVIRTPRILRSQKWISTSMPIQHFERELAKYFSVEYLINSLVNPVNFHQAFKYVPTDAICIEVSPKNILKTILKESTWTKPFPEMSWIPLMKQKNYRMETTPIVNGGYLEHFWYVFGKLHLKGINVDCVKLFVPLKHVHTIYPVPINHLTSWKWEEPKFEGKEEYIRKFFEELKFVEEPKFLEQEWTRKYVEEPKFLEQEFTRKYVEEPKFLEQEYTRKYIDEPKYFEQEWTRKYIEEPKFVQKEFVRQYEQNIMFEQPEFLSINHSTPIVFKYPIDLTSTLFQTELVEHKIDGRVVYPTSGYLYMVWKSLAKMQGLNSVEQLPVVFETVEFHRPTIMTIRGTPVKKLFTFEVRIVPTTGLFEVLEDGVMIVTGRVSIPNQRRVENYTLMTPTGLEFLRHEEIYNELKMKGFHYGTLFQPIIKTDLNAKYADMLWTGKWVPFLEGMIQMKALAKRSIGGVMIPRRIRSLYIDPTVHMQIVEKKMMNNERIMNSEFLMPKMVVIPVVYDRYTQKTVAGGIEIVGIKCVFVPTFEKIEREIFNVERNLVNKVLLNEEPIVEEEILEQIKREYVEFYLRECKRYTEYILKRIELPTPTTTIKMIRPFVSTPIPVTLKHLIEKINRENKYFKHQQVVATLLEGGEFLRFLKNVVEQIETIKEESILCKLQCLFNENMYFYKALEKDTILSLINMKSYFFECFKTILEQEKQTELLNSWNVDPRLRLQEQFGLLNLETRRPLSFIQTPKVFLPKYF